ncbi:hypothetical protein DYB26_003145 [Aphanomyces astaci]|uniref:DUF8040 domain-containing protein n=1 Tax=Aphanomyces astaci TaxID=112090 RepID=A0A397C8Z2_APHAT|nr:hypothetical protein DYB38_000790 [Aphanomyces astaci]RHY80432.1 hypothetical protein DYB26_003145 [Aphanomyces astaci]
MSPPLESDAKATIKGIQVIPPPHNDKYASGQVHADRSMARVNGGLASTVAADHEDAVIPVAARHNPYTPDPLLPKSIEIAESSMESLPGPSHDEDSLFYELEEFEARRFGDVHPSEPDDERSSAASTEDSLDVQDETMKDLDRHVASKSRPTEEAAASHTVQATDDGQPPHVKVTSQVSSGAASDVSSVGRTQSNFAKKRSFPSADDTVALGPSRAFGVHDHLVADGETTTDSVASSSSSLPSTPSTTAAPPLSHIARSYLSDLDWIRHLASVQDVYFQVLAILAVLWVDFCAMARLCLSDGYDALGAGVGRLVVLYQWWKHDVLSTNDDLQLLVRNAWGLALLTALGAAFGSVYVMLSQAPRVGLDLVATWDDTSKDTGRGVLLDDLRALFIFKMDLRRVLLVRRWTRARRRRLMHMYLMYHYMSFVLKTPKRNSVLTGSLWVTERLSGNEEAFVEEFRMPKQVFALLVSELVQVAGLKATRQVSANEQLALFLFFAGHHSSSAQLQSRFQHSGETVTRCASISKVTATLRIIPFYKKKRQREKC